MSIYASLLVAANAVAAATETTDPSQTWYSPGIVGFLLTFFVAGGAVLLIFDMVRRIRRVRYRAEIQEKLANEQAAAEAKKATKPKAADGDAASGSGEKHSRPAPPPKPKRD